MASSAIQICPQDPSAQIRCGMKGTFQVTVLNAKKKPMRRGEVICTFRTEWGETIAGIRHDLSRGNPFSVSAVPEKPGFLRCDAAYKDQTAFAVIACEPEKITASQSCPEDLYDFWQQEKSAAMQIPLDLKMEKLDRLSSEDYTGYAIDFANINGTRMYGYLSIPTAAGVHPAGIVIPGAGPGLTEIPGDYPRDSVIVLAMNIHTYAVEPETSRARYDELMRDQHYYLHGLPDRRQYYFHRAILGLCKSIDVIRALPEWDGSHLAVTGSSQGGGLSLALAALHADWITAAAVDVPGACELVPGLRVPTHPWTQICAMPEGPSLLPYFDMVNLVPLIRCPMLWSVGLRDENCVPRTVYAAYNRLRSEKFLWIGTHMTHKSDPEYARLRKSWLLQQLFK